MTKPEISLAKMAEYEQQAEIFIVAFNIPQIVPTGESREYFKQMFIAGEWLADELRENNATLEDVDKMGHAFGQRCFGREPWTVAQEQLRKWLAGEKDEPGEKLADEIIAEQFRGTPSEEKTTMEFKFTSYFGILILNITELNENGKRNANLIMGNLGPDENELKKVAEENCGGDPFLIYQIMQPPEDLRKQLVAFFLANNVPENELSSALLTFSDGLKGILKKNDKVRQNENS